MIGIIVTTAAIRLSMIIPIILSVFFWNERVNFYQKIGILTALVALPLLFVLFLLKFGHTGLKIYLYT